MNPDRRTVVSVQIAGDDYAIRTDASEEYTRECAAYVDQMVRDILDGSAMLQPHKASILAALAITDQLFRLQRETDAFREEAVRRAANLAEEISSRLEARGLATRS